MHFLILFAMGGLSGLVSSALQKGSAPRRPQIDVAVGVMCDDARLVRFDDATHWIHHEEVGRIVAELAHP